MVEATVEEFHKVLVVRVPGPEGSGDRELGLGHGWGWSHALNHLAAVPCGTRCTAAAAICDSSQLFAIPLNLLVDQGPL